MTQTPEQAFPKKTLDDYFSDWEGSAFGYGYGTGEAFTIPALKMFFSRLRENRLYEYTDLETMYGGLAAWLLINILCNEDILEYGTSPRYGWLTDKGERLRDFIQSKTGDELYALANRDQEYVPCYRDACNCGEHGYDEKAVCANPFWRSKP